jgi:hypothetical protein
MYAVDVLKRVIQGLNLGKVLKKIGGCAHVSSQPGGLWVYFMKCLVYFLAVTS